MNIARLCHRSLLKTFTGPRSYINKHNCLGTSFSNHGSAVPLSTTKLSLKDEKVKLSFVLNDGRRIDTEGKVGDTLLDVVVNNDLNIEGYGACEGTLTCSTCHVILKQKDFDRLPEEASDEERDMLDLAYGLTDTSRLGCQITLTKDLEGLEVTVPETINDVRS
ncbi:adrenodoxin-like protein 2, mitochondrial Ferredoxin 2 [Aphomia sociella]